MALTQGIPSPTRLCESLTYQQADEIFFPSIPGKKPTKAKALCSGCPFVASCLMEAIEGDLKGFWAGTTEPERKVMASLNKIVQKKYDELIPEPEKPTAARSKYLHVIKTPENHAWIDEVEPSDTEIFLLEAV